MNNKQYKLPQAAIKKLVSIVGKNWVFTDAKDLDTYRDSYSPFWGTDQEIKVSAAVAPSNTEEVQKIVRVANEFEIPVYPISTGKNLGYGGAAPNMDGSVCIDLKRMNKILEIDSTRCFALVEPGVSYFDLYNYIQEHDLDLWIDCPEPGWGSVMGNALERGVGYTGQNYRDHFGAHCGLEVVLPNAEVIRTGMGALPGSSTWQDYKYGFGPYVDGLFSQGNYGIVTKMGIHLMPRPESMLAGVVEVENYHDVTPLINVLNKLEKSGICDGMPLFGSPVLGSLGADPNPELTKIIGTPGAPSVESLKKVSEGKAYWTLRLLFYGPKNVVNEKWEYAKKQFRHSIKNCKFSGEVTYEIPLSAKEEEALEPFRLDLDRKVNFGIPNLGIFSMGARSPAFPKPVDGHLWFSAIIPRSGEGVMKAQNIFCKAISDMGVYIGFNAPVPLAYTPHMFLMIFPVFLSKSDPEMNRKGLELLKYLLIP